MRGRLIVFGACAAIAALGVAAPWAVNAVFDALDVALGWMGGVAAVTLVSAGVGILFLLAFPHVSSQRGIRAVKDRIKHNLLAVRLFQDDLPTVARSTAGTLGWNFAYLGLNLAPMLVLAAPFMLVWFQLNALYAFEPLDRGKEEMVVAELAPGVRPQEVEVALPAGVELVQRVNLADPAEPRILLRVLPASAGDHRLTLAHGGATVTKSLAVETRPRRLARVRTARPWSLFAAARDPMVYFGEPVLPEDGFVRTVEVGYPPAPLGFLDGGEISIAIWFVIVSLAVGFGLKGVFKVEI